MADGPVARLRFIPDPKNPIDRAIVDPALAAMLEMSYSPPGFSHPVRYELDIPLSRHLFFVTLRAPLGREGYTFDLVGADPPPGTVDIHYTDNDYTFDLVGADPPSKAARAMPLFGVPNMAFWGIPVLVAYRRRVLHRDTPVSLDARWHPERGESMGIKGVEQDPRKKSLERIHKGIALLRAIKRHTGGRSRGTRKIVEDEFRKRYPVVYQEQLDAYESKPLRKEVADALGLDPDTFREYLRTYGLPFPPV